MSLILSETISDQLAGNFGYVIAGLIVLVGLAVGLADLLRLSPRRVWAIGSVGFRESIRRRVLFVTPLAMLGIIAVSQLSHPFDEQDAIRQTTKYCLFASGVVVVIASLILACTSLPKEIDNRVIYTIVTKPATRLEIVLGKTIGFACTSAVILLVMGLFSYGYLRVNAAQLTSAIRQRLATLPQTAQSRDTLQHYVDQGLLQARTYAEPAPLEWGTAPSLQVYAKLPQPSDLFRWIFGNNEQDVIFPYELPADVFDHPDAQLVFTLQVATEQPRPLTQKEIESELHDATATTRPTTQGAKKLPPKPRITVTMLNENGYTVLTAGEIMDALHLSEADTKSDPSAFKNANSVLLEPSGKPGVGQAIVVVSSKYIQERVKTIQPSADGKRRAFLMISGQTLATRYGFGPDAVGLTALIPDASGKPINLPIPRTNDAGKEMPPVFRGRLTTTRYQQLRGDPDRDEAPVAVFEFHDKKLRLNSDLVPFEFRTKVERSDDAEASESDNATRIEVRVRNHKTGFASPPLEVTVDSDRPTFFRVPRAALEGGDFDMTVRSRTRGHYVGLRTTSVAAVSSTESFAFNLLKSLLILWMLSVLVIIIAVFCSTFVSWPIAVVLTLVILLGRWCVTQLGEPASPQQMATDFFGANASPVQARVFTDTMSGLNKLLNLTAKILPDVDKFKVTEEIERGVSISARTMYDSVGVILMFGVPMLILAYLLLRRKEVAP
jgi:ABC-type transport system involved in multi-copper enzyme maturation permease subunit